ncbi:MAG: PilX N-terminal domain-containing pilus assembly protein [Candidatus Methylomirabilales bacterium]
MVEKNTAKVIQDERGIALVISLLVMTLLTLVGTMFLNISTTESTISRNEISTARVFQLSEAGIQHAKKSLESKDLSDVIADTATVFATGNSASLGGGTYTVDVTNNFGAGFPRGTIPADAVSGACTPSATVDCDRIVVVNATGNFQGNEQIVEAIIRVPAPLAISGALSTLDGTDTPSAEAEDIESSASIDGNDCNPPSAGGGPGPGPDKPGIGVESAAARGDLISDINDPSTVTGGGGGSPDVQIDPDTMSGSELTVVVNALIASGTAIGTAPCNGGTYGTPASPQVCYGTSIPSGSTGAGILVFTDDVEIENLTYEGIIIVVGSGRFRMFGSSNIYGAVIQKNYTGSHSGETRFRMEDSASICYSSAAVQTASSNSEVGGATMAWYEQ